MVNKEFAGDAPKIAAVSFGSPTKLSPALRERVAKGRVRAHVNLRAIVRRRSPQLSPPKNWGEEDIEASPNKRPLRNRLLPLLTILSRQISQMLIVFGQVSFHRFTSGTRILAPDGF